MSTSDKRLSQEAKVVLEHLPKTVFLPRSTNLKRCYTTNENTKCEAPNKYNEEEITKKSSIHATVKKEKKVFEAVKSEIEGFSKEKQSMNNHSCYVKLERISFDPNPITLLNSGDNCIATSKFKEWSSNEAKINNENKESLKGLIASNISLKRNLRKRSHPDNYLEKKRNILNEVEPLIELIPTLLNKTEETEIVTVQKIQRTNETKIKNENKESLKGLIASNISLKRNLQKRSHSDKNYLEKKRNISNEVEPLIELIPTLLNNTEETEIVTVKKIQRKDKHVVNIDRETDQASLSPTINKEELIDQNKYATITVPSSYLEKCKSMTPSLSEPFKTLLNIKGKAHSSEAITETSLNILKKPEENENSSNRFSQESCPRTLLNIKGKAHSSEAITETSLNILKKPEENENSSNRFSQESCPRTLSNFKGEAYSPEAITESSLNILKQLEENENSSNRFTQESCPRTLSNFKGEVHSPEAITETSLNILEKPEENENSLDSFTQESCPRTLSNFKGEAYSPEAIAESSLNLLKQLEGNGNSSGRFTQRSCPRTLSNFKGEAYSPEAIAESSHNILKQSEVNENSSDRFTEESCLRTLSSFKGEAHSPEVNAESSLNILEKPEENGDSSKRFTQESCPRTLSNFKREAHSPEVIAECSLNILKKPEENGDSSDRFSQESSPRTLSNFKREACSPEAIAESSLNILKKPEENGHSSDRFTQESCYQTLGQPQLNIEEEGSITVESNFKSTGGGFNYVASPASEKYFVEEEVSNDKPQDQSLGKSDIQVEGKGPSNEDNTELSNKAVNLPNFDYVKELSLDCSHEVIAECSLNILKKPEENGDSSDRFTQESCPRTLSNFTKEAYPPEAISEPKLNILKKPEENENSSHRFTQESCCQTLGQPQVNIEEEVSITGESNFKSTGGGFNYVASPASEKYFVEVEVSNDIHQDQSLEKSDIQVEGKGLSNEDNTELSHQAVNLPNFENLKKLSLDCSGKLTIQPSHQSSTNTSHASSRHQPLKRPDFTPVEIAKNLQSEATTTFATPTSEVPSENFKVIKVKPPQALGIQNQDFSQYPQNFQQSQNLSSEHMLNISQLCQIRSFPRNESRIAEICRLYPLFFTPEARCDISLLIKILYEASRSLTMYEVQTEKCDETYFTNIQSNGDKFVKTFKGILKLQEIGCDGDLLKKIIPILYLHMDKAFKRLRPGEDFDFRIIMKKMFESQNFVCDYDVILEKSYEMFQKVMKTIDRWLEDIFTECDLSSISKPLIASDVEEMFSRQLSTDYSEDTTMETDDDTAIPKPQKDTDSQTVTVCNVNVGLDYLHCPACRERLPLCCICKELLRCPCLIEIHQTLAIDKGPESLYFCREHAKCGSNWPVWLDSWNEEENSNISLNPVCWNVSCTSKAEYLCVCRVKAYCSRPCQVEDWYNGHYEICRLESDPECLLHSEDEVMDVS